MRKKGKEISSLTPGEEDKKGSKKQTSGCWIISLVEATFYHLLLLPTHVWCIVFTHILISCISMSKL